MEVFAIPDWRILPPEIAYDWLLDHDVPPMIASEVMARPIRSRDINRFFTGGSGSGSGIGIGSGSGSGDGIGGGSGSGNGRGSGSGNGRGSGSGFGIGIGCGIDIEEKLGVAQMEVGKAYLSHCGDWHTFVFRVVAQVGPMTYKVESLSKVHDTNNGDCWEDLAAGNATARSRATYRHYKVAAVVPLTIVAFEWLGLTPQEAGEVDVQDPDQEAE